MMGYSNWGWMPWHWSLLLIGVIMILPPFGIIFLERVLFFVLWEFFSRKDT